MASFGGGSGILGPLRSSRGTSLRLGYQNRTGREVSVNLRLGSFLCFRKAE